MTDKNEALMARLRYRLSKASGGQAIVDEDDLESVIDIIDQSGALIEMLASELRAVHAATEAKVRQLEWQWRDDTHGGRFEADARLETDGAIGRYKVWGADFASWKWSTHLGRSDSKSYLSAAEAKSAAQSDFEGIVRAALSGMPASAEPRP